MGLPSRFSPSPQPFSFFFPFFFFFFSFPLLHSHIASRGPQVSGGLMVGLMRNKKKKLEKEGGRSDAFSSLAPLHLFPDNFLFWMGDFFADIPRTFLVPHTHRTPRARLF